MTSTALIILWIVIAMITSSLTFLFVFRKLRQQRETLHTRRDILAEGIQAKALIQAVRQTSSTMDDRPGIELDLMVTEPSGHSFPATVRTFISVIDIPRFQQGAWIDVKYKMTGNDRKVEVEGAYLPFA